MNRKAGKREGVTVPATLTGIPWRLPSTAG